LSQIRRDLFPNYIAGLSIIFVFLGGFVYILGNLETIVDGIVVEGDATGTAIRSAISTAIVTAMIFITKEVTTYFFRKNPKPNIV